MKETTKDSKNSSWGSEPKEWPKNWQDEMEAMGSVSVNKNRIVAVAVEKVRK